MPITTAEQFRKNNANSKADSAYRRRREAADKLLSEVILPTMNVMAESGIVSAVINMARNCDIVQMIRQDLVDSGYEVRYRRFRRELVISWDAKS